TDTEWCRRSGSSSRAVLYPIGQRLPGQLVAGAPRSGRSRTGRRRGKSGQPAKPTPSQPGRNQLGAAGTRLGRGPPRTSGRALDSPPPIWRSHRRRGRRRGIPQPTGVLAQAAEAPGRLLGFVLMSRVSTNVSNRVLRLVSLRNIQDISKWYPLECHIDDRKCYGMRICTCLSRQCWSGSASAWRAHRPGSAVLRLAMRGDIFEGQCAGADVLDGQSVHWQLLVVVVFDFNNNLISTLTLLSLPMAIDADRWSLGAPAGPEGTLSAIDESSLSMTRDSFIDEEMKPKESPFAIKGVTGLFRRRHGSPSPEMISRAYQHYNRKSFRRHFDSWLQFHLYGGGGWSKSEEFWPKPDGHFFQTKLDRYSAPGWSGPDLGRAARPILQRVLHVSVVRVMFKAWHGVSLEARKTTREYFERLNAATMSPRTRCSASPTGEAATDLSLVSESLRQQILRHLSLADMSRAPARSHLSSEPAAQASTSASPSAPDPPVAKKFLAQSGPMLATQPGRCRDLPLEVFQRCRWQIVQALSLLIYVNLSFTGISDNKPAFKHAGIVRSSGWRCQQLSDRRLAVLAQGQGVHKLELLDRQRGGSGSGLALPFSGALRAVRPAPASPTTASAPSAIAASGLDKNDIITDAPSAIWASLPELHQLCVADCVRVTDQAPSASFATFALLNLADCVRLSDAGAKSIAEASFGCQSLRELNLTNASASTDHGVTAICKKGPGLTHLRLSFCENLTHLSADSLANYCPGLVSLDMSGTGHERFAMSVLGSLSRMRYLYLPTVTDLGLQKLVQQLRYLEHLDLSHCVQLTDGGVRSMSFSCRLLTKLSLRGCRQLTELEHRSTASVIRMTRRIPSVTHSTQDPPGTRAVSTRSVKQLSSVGLIKLTMNITSYCK
uniref:F-box domain-containing protein n=1 Tax=Macrostomum lignano TaxID=282301 RepID=A0A1I8F4X4_9PLAT